MATSLSLPGIAGSYASAPDSAALSITGAENGGITLLARVAPDYAVPATVGTIIAKWGGAGQRSYRLLQLTTGVLRLGITADGTNIVEADSSIVAGFTNEQPLWVLASWRDSDNRVQFFTASGTIPRSALLASDFTQLGTDRTLALAGIFDSTAVLEMGTGVTGTNSPLAGKLYNGLVYNGVFSTSAFGGSLVFDADFTAVTKTSGRTPTSFTESSSNAATVTINGTQWDWYDGWASLLAVQRADAADATSYATASWTPRPNRLYLAWISSTVTTGPHNAPTSSSNGITWTQIEERGQSGTSHLTLLAGFSGASPSAGTFTADFGGQTQLGCIIQIIEVDGADMSGTVAAAFADTIDGGGTGTSDSVTLGSTPASSARCFSAVTIALNEAITPRTNWTEIGEIGHNTPARRVETQWRALASEDTASASWTNSAADRMILVAVKGAFQTLTPSSIGTGYASGTAALLFQSLVEPSAIASLAALGTAHLARLIAASGIATGYGSGSVVVLSAIGPSGVVTGEVIGSHTLHQRILMAALGSVEAFGTLTIGIPVPLAGIPSSEAWGTPSLAIRLLMAGVGSGFAAGTTQLHHRLLMTGITTGEAWGTPNLNFIQSIYPGAIGSGQAFGTTILHQRLLMVGLASAQAFGTAALARTVVPSGVASATAFGTPLLQFVRFILPASISSVESFGTANLGLVIQVTGMASGESFGLLIFRVPMLYVFDLGSRTSGLVQPHKVEGHLVP